MGFAVAGGAGLNRILAVNYDSLQKAIQSIPQRAGSTPPGYERDAVCLLLVERAETMILAVQKADRAGYRWRDHVALPGGQVDPLDQDARDAALRELHEELAIDRADVDVFGSLGHFQTYDTKNDLEVVLGCWTRPSPVNIDRREIERVVELSLNNLVKQHLGQRFRGRPSSQIGSALVYDLPDARIWGVTARILHAFLELVLNHRLLRQDST